MASRLNRTTIGLVCTVGAVLSIMATPALAAPIHSDAADRAASNQIVNARTQTVPGTRDAAGNCISGFHPTMQSGSPAGEAIKVAEDRDTCSETWKFGAATPAEAKKQAPSASGFPAGGQDLQAQQGQVGQSSDAIKGSDPVAAAQFAPQASALMAPLTTAAYSRHRAYIKTRVVGRFFGGDRDESWVYNSVSYEYGGGCVHNPVYYGTSHDSFEGFVRTGNDWATGASCSFAYSSSLETFRNDNRSCGSGGPALNTYNRNSIHGNSNGSYTPYPDATSCVADIGGYIVSDYGFF